MADCTPLTCRGGPETADSRCDVGHALTRTGPREGPAWPVASPSLQCAPTAGRISRKQPDSPPGPVGRDNATAAWPTCRASARRRPCDRRRAVSPRGSRHGRRRAMNFLQPIVMVMARAVRASTARWRTLGDRLKGRVRVPHAREGMRCSPAIPHLPCVPLSLRCRNSHDPDRPALGEVVSGKLYSGSAVGKM